MFSQSQPVARQVSAKITGEGGLSDHPSLCIGHIYCAMSSKRKESAYLIGENCTALFCFFVFLFFAGVIMSLHINTHAYMYMLHNKFLAATCN